MGAINTQIRLELLPSFRTFGNVLRGTIRKAALMKVINNATKRKYYSLDALRKINANYNLIFGERSNGKSYAVKIECINAFLKNGEQCVFIRRYDTEIKKPKLDSYWSDIPIDVLSNGEYNEIYAYGGKLFVAKNENGKRINAVCFGFAMSLNLAQSYASTEYPHVTRIVLEEFIALDGKYLSNELFLFNHIISTVARRRNVFVYLIANSVSRISPYWREYSVEDVIKNQKQGTICVIERETLHGDKQIVAVEYCANTSGRSLMFAGNRGGMVNDGKWLVNEQPHLPTNREEWELIYIFVVQYKNYRYLVEYITNNNDFCLYVTPKTTPIQRGTRVVSDIPNPNPMYSLGLTPLNSRERDIFKLITDGKIFYSDNQTGTEFNECVKNLKRVFI